MSTAHSTTSDTPAIPHTQVRTRIAPSPTGFLHLGTARTALFSWAYARRHGGQFILRIEDTDVARSSQEAVDAIITSMKWLGMDYDEGPYFQMQRIDRYKQVIAQMLAEGTAYHCYTSQEELQAMRDAQQARGERMRYDGTWRPEPGKTLPPVPAGAQPVVRFKNPTSGAVQWNDLVKGPISINNEEMDDLIIARSEGTPTYNFCVVVDDWDMRITHVIRGDDHVNNTPRQINILRALNAPLPQYGHVPMINGPDGQKLSKRHGAVSVMQYEEQGFLPDGMINYLARLGWSHGDDELFSRAQLIEWFNLEHLARASAQWDPKKLAWVNNHHIKTSDNQALAALVQPIMQAQGVDTTAAGTPPLTDVIGLFKDRAETLVQLAQNAQLFYTTPQVTDELKQQHNVATALPALQELAAAFAALPAWDAPSIQAAIKAAVASSGLKMPQIAVPLRVLVTGQPQTPSVDQVLALFGRETVLARLKAHV